MNDQHERAKRLAKAKRSIDEAITTLPTHEERVRAVEAILRGAFTNKKSFDRIIAKYAGAALRKSRQS